MSKYAIGKTSSVGRTNQRLKNKRVANMNQSLMNQGVANKVTWGGMFPNLWLQHPCSSNFGSCLQCVCWESPCHALSQAFGNQGSWSVSMVIKLVFMFNFQRRTLKPTFEEQARCNHEPKFDEPGCCKQSNLGQDVPNTLVATSLFIKLWFMFATCLLGISMPCIVEKPSDFKARCTSV